MARPRISREAEIARFWSKVEKSDGCWNWQGCCTPYGCVWFGNKNASAHRVSYELHYGPIPCGLFVCHTCDNPRCVRPDHLWLGTNADNIRDRNAKGRANHPAGSRHHSFKMTQAVVEAARSMRDRGMAYKEIGKSLGIGVGTAWVAVNGKPKNKRPPTTTEQQRRLILQCRDYGMSVGGIADIMGLSKKIVWRVSTGRVVRPGLLAGQNAEQVWP